MTDSPKYNGVAWAAELSGDEADLEDLVHWTRGNKIAVRKLKLHYELVMPFDDVGLDYKTVKLLAAEYLAALNGIGAVQEPAFQAVSLIPGLNTIEADGTRRDVIVTVIGSESRRGRTGKITVRVDGQVEPDPSEGMAGKQVTLALANKDLEAALQLLGRGSPTWSELYVVYELANTACSGRIEKSDWASAKELIRFRRTVNNYRTLGLQARHGPSNDEPPSNPMDHQDAIGLLRQVVGAWLRSERQRYEELGNAVSA